MRNQTYLVVRPTPYVVELTTSGRTSLIRPALKSNSDKQAGLIGIRSSRGPPMALRPPLWEARAVKWSTVFVLLSVVAYGCGSDATVQPAQTTSLLLADSPLGGKEPVFWHQACVIQQEVMSAHWRTMEAQAKLNVSPTEQNLVDLDYLAWSWSEIAGLRADDLDALVRGLSDPHERMFGSNLQQVSDYVAARVFEPVDGLELDNAEVCFSHGYFPILCGAVGELHTSMDVAFSVEATTCFEHLDEIGRSRT